MNVVSAGALVCRAFAKVDHGCCKQIDLVLSSLQRQARSIERPGGVGPVEMTDQAHLSENQLLAADAKQDSGTLRLSEFKVSLSYIHRVFEWRRVRLDVPAEGLGVLRLDLEAHPVRRTHAHIEPHAIKRIGVARIRSESAAVES